MKALIIDDMKRLGGGRRSAFIFAGVLSEMGFDTYFLTNAGNVEGNKVAFTVKYEFIESSPRIVDFIKIMSLKRQLFGLDISTFDFSLNHHPNIFIKRGSANVLHGFSFLDPWVDEDGEVISSMQPALLKLAGLYGLYDGALFLPNSRYTSIISGRLFKYIGLDAVLGDVLYPPILYSEPAIDEKKEQVLLMGRINPDKGIEEAVEIANEEGLRLVVAGYLNKGDEGYYLKLKGKAKANVEILPNITNVQKGFLMKESSTILSLNRKENFGISIAEAEVGGQVLMCIE